MWPRRPRHEPDTPAPTRAPGRPATPPRFLPERIERGGQVPAGRPAAPRLQAAPPAPPRRRPFPPRVSSLWPPEIDALWARGLSTPGARHFHLVRARDVSGVSGVGIVADGIQLPEGVVLLEWRGHRPSRVVWQSIGDAMAVHGHDGATTVEWTTPRPEET